MEGNTDGTCTEASRAKEGGKEGENGMDEQGRTDSPGYQETYLDILGKARLS